MDPNSKRRKLDHGGGGSGLRHDGLIDFESRDSTRVSTASTFVLQTDELLKEAKLDYTKALQDVDTQLHRMKGIIESIEPHDPLPIAEAAAKFEKKHRVVIPFPDPKPAQDAPYKLSFEKPAQCNVVGSYVSRTMAKAQARRAVDMVVQMPKSLFQEKDFANMRYFYRRAYYIAYIAAHVRKAVGEDMHASFEELHENPLLPILILRVSPKAEVNGKGAKKSTQSGEFVIRVIPCAPEDLFPRSKLNPGANNNRVADLDEKKTAAATTPFYNSTLHAESTFIQYLRVLTHAKNECPALPDACVLGRIWLQQRGFGGQVSQGGFGHFEWAAMTALLLQMGGRNGQAALSSSLSSAELFKAAIQFLATTDFNKRPYTFGSTKVSPDMVREPGPIAFDPVRQLNLLSKMSPWSANLLQMHAKATTDLLADDAAEKFESIFIVKADAPLQIYDSIFEVNFTEASLPNSCDRRGSAWDFSLDAHRVLKRAYGNRAQLIYPRQATRTPWALNASHASKTNAVTVGVTFDPVHMSRQMDHGPPAEEQKEAARFRQFWGEKAELRRFKDGSILECVEWSSRLPSDVCEGIARYALKRHVKVAKDQISFYRNNVSSVLNISPVDKDAFDTAQKAFQTFENDVRSLEELPLEIRQLSPISPDARYASVNPPLPGYHRGSVEPMDVNIYFEASSRWPDNLVAIQQAKIEFLLDLDTRLTAAHENITTYLGRENRDVGIENLAYLDVVYDSGAAFRLRIHCELEEALLERQVNNKTLHHQVRDESEQALAKFRWPYTILPLHTQTIATFCTRLAPLSPAVRLVKQWFRSHKLAGHVGDELIELLVLHVFLQPYPWRMPSSARMGFLRTLAFLARWDWRDEPLIVDSAEELDADDRHAVRRNLDAWRQRDPNLNHTVLFVATSHETSGTAYTRNGPSRLIASRMTRLAKAATKLVKDQGIHLDIPQLFETSLRDYDVLIHLSPKALKAASRDAATQLGSAGSKKHHAGGAARREFKNLDADPLPVRAQPADVLIAELQRVYDDALVFFRGGDEGGAVAGDDAAAVGAIWNPKLQRQKFRAGLPYNFARVRSNEEGEDGADVVEVNRRAVLSEIARVGGDLIKRIEVDE